MISNKLTALVTGGNRSIGKEVVRKLGVLGYTVFMGSRDVVKGNQARDELLKLHPEIDIRVLELDTSNRKSIESAVQVVSSQTDGKLDVLINNAGILADFTPASSVDIDKIKEHFDVNFYGVILTTQGFLPLLRQGYAKSIVNVSTILASLSETLNKDFEFYKIQCFAYNASKTALNAYSAHLGVELEQDGFRVNSVHPGHVGTDINAFSGPLTVDEGTKAIIHYATLDSTIKITGQFFDDKGPIQW
eukprot:gene1968-2419_t